MKLTTLHSLTLVSLFVSAQAFSAVHVVVHKSNGDEFDKQSISRIFLGKAKSFPSGASAIPINQSENMEVTTLFNREVLNKSNSQLKAYWSKLVFTGKGTPPQAVSNDNEVIELVKNNPNFIGFISDTSVIDNVKIIATFP